MERIFKLLIVMILVMTGCRQEDTVININPSELQLSADGSGKSVTISSNQTWNATSDVAWAKVDPASGTGNATIRVYADQNDDFDIRTARVTISSSVTSTTLTVTQKGQTPVLDVSDGTVEVPAKGGSFMLKVQYNMDYEVNIASDAASWIRFVETKAISTDNLTFEVDANASTSKRTGQVTLSGKEAGTNTVIIFSQEAYSPDKEALMAIYDKMGGSNSWRGWATDKPLDDWENVVMKDGRVSELYLNSLDPVPSGVLPEEIGLLSELNLIIIRGESVQGNLPESCRNWTKMENLSIFETSMSGELPDIFGEWKNLRKVTINHNPGMTGPLPASLGTSPVLEKIVIGYNGFTGTIPDEWLEKDKMIGLYYNNLSGKFPDKFYEMPSVSYSFWESFIQGKDDDGSHTHLMDISDAPFIPARYSPYEYEDLHGRKFMIDDIVKENKYTIVVHWGIMNPFGTEMMDQIKYLYETYHDRGLDIIAANSYDLEAGISEASLRQYLNEHGYDKWHNVKKIFSYPMVNPAAEVIDQHGHLLFSYDWNLSYKDVFNHTAVYDLTPFIKQLFGDYDPKHVSTDFSRDGEVVTLQKATSGKGINLVFLGDAYPDIDMGTGGHYETMMQNAMEEFFAIEPYKSFRDRFNVYTVKAVSKNCTLGDGMETRFHTSPGSGRELKGDVELCFEYAMKVPGIDSKEDLVVATLVNGYNGGATCVSQYGYNAAVSFISTYNDIADAYGPVVRHEVGGHGFAHLADEYDDYDEYPDEQVVQRAIDQYNGKGWWANIDFTSDPEKIKWARFLKDERYSDSVGVVEGGYVYKYGVWRPTEDSIMYSNVGKFNAPSRDAIYKRIMELSGEEYSFEKFLLYDAINR